MIQNSIFKISCGIKPRGLPAAERTGLRRRGAAFRRGLLRAAAIPSGTANSEFKIQHSKLAAASNLGACPQPSGRACDVEEQPSARGRLRAAAPCGRKFMIQNSIFKISRSVKPRGLPAAERTGLLSSSARLQPFARGRLRAAGRCATACSSRHFLNQPGSCRPSLPNYSVAGPFGSSVPSGSVVSSSGSVVSSSGSGAIRPRASSIARLSGSLPRKAR